MTRLTKDEKEELAWLRKSAAKFMTDPLERAFFELGQIVDRPADNRVDSIMPSSAFRALSKALILLKQEFDKVR